MQALYRSSGVGTGMGNHSIGQECSVCIRPASINIFTTLIKLPLSPLSKNFFCLFVCLFQNIIISSGRTACQPLEKQPQCWNKEVFRRRHHRRGFSKNISLSLNYLGLFFITIFTQAVISTMKDQLARPNYRTIRMIVNAMRSLDQFSKMVYHF